MLLTLTTILLHILHQSIQIFHKIPHHQLFHPSKTRAPQLPLTLQILPLYSTLLLQLPFILPAGFSPENALETFQLMQQAPSIGITYEICFINSVKYCGYSSSWIVLLALLSPPLILFCLCYVITLFLVASSYPLLCYDRWHTLP